MEKLTNPFDLDALDNLWQVIHGSKMIDTFLNNLLVRHVQMNANRILNFQCLHTIKQDSQKLHVYTEIISSYFSDPVAPELKREHKHLYTQVFAEIGFLNALKWARANGCPWDRQNCLRFAQLYHHSDIEHWISQN